MWIMLSEWDVDFVYVARIKLDFYHAWSAAHHTGCNKTANNIPEYVPLHKCIYGTRHINLRVGFSNYAQLKHKSIMLCVVYTLCAELVVIAWRMQSPPNTVLERRCALHFYTLSIEPRAHSLSQSSRTFCLYITKNNV